jgi:hypothetical protein
MIGAAVVNAHFVAGKATRDALYLGNLDVTSLPAMVMATSAVSILLVFLSSTVLRRLPPGVFVPALFVLNGLLLVAEWGLASIAPVAAAIAVYLQIAGLGPMLGSGFWLLTTERFDPRTAKRRFGQIAGLGTVGGLLGGLLAERMAAVLPVDAMLPLLAAMSLAGGWLMRRLAGPLPHQPSATTLDMAPDLSAEPSRSGLKVLARAPYLRNLAGVVLLGTVGASLVDYLFKVEAVSTFGREEGLLRFFAIFYAAVGVLTFVVQTTSTRLVLEKFGLGASTASPSAALLFGSFGTLIAPGIEGTMAARAGESIFRGSLFRAGYEVFYTPILPAEKRSVKSIIDVGFDRLGDAVGGGLVSVLLMLTPLLQSKAIMVGAILCSAGALVMARRLNRGYIQTLERNLMNRAVDVDLSTVEDLTTRTVVLQTLSAPRPVRAPEDRQPEGHTSPRPRPAPANESDGILAQVGVLRSRDQQHILEVLRSEEKLPLVLVAHVIPLTAWDPIAEEAMKALRSIAPACPGQLVDALIDPSQPFAVRRRLARVLSSSTSQRAVDGLLLGLEDSRFEVRFQCGRSLAAILARNRNVRVDAKHVFKVVLQEVAVGRPVWESHQLLDRLDDHETGSFVDEFVKARASRSLAHVFTLMALVLPAEPLQIAFRGLFTDDQGLRGTALEYLEGVLPPNIRDGLWPFLDDPRTVRSAGRPREEILEELLRSNQSIIMNLEELKRRARAANV